MAEVDDLFGENFVCALCEEEIIDGGKYNLCENCYAGLDFISRACEKCGDRVGEFDRFCLNCKSDHKDFDFCICVAKLKDTGKDLIYKLKYGKQPFVANAISKMMVEKYKEKINETFDFVTYVPITRAKMKERGFCQTELIAKNLANELNIELKENLILRIKDNKEQTELNKDERRKNLEGVFVIDDSIDLTNKSVLVVDDVYTTGATMQEMNKLLRSKNAQKVCGIMFCHS